MADLPCGRSLPGFEFMWAERIAPVVGGWSVSHPLVCFVGCGLVVLMGGGLFPRGVLVARGSESLVVLHSLEGCLSLVGAVFATDVVFLTECVYRLGVRCH